MRPLCVVCISPFGKVIIHFFFFDVKDVFSNIIFMLFYSSSYNLFMNMLNKCDIVAMNVVSNGPQYVCPITVIYWGNAVDESPVEIVSYTGPQYFG